MIFPIVPSEARNTALGVMHDQYLLYSSASRAALDLFGLVSPVLSNQVVILPTFSFMNHHCPSTNSFRGVTGSHNSTATKFSENSVLVVNMAYMTGPERDGHPQTIRA